MPVSDRRFFKVWADPALLSDDLDDLSDHERTVWLFAMCVASTEDPRWSAQISSRLAKKCKSTLPKLQAALAHMASLGMVEIVGDRLSFINAHRWNEDTERRRKPSDEPEAARKRKQEERDRKNGVTPDVTRDTEGVTPPVTPSHAAHKEEEKEQEEEEEEEEDPRDTPQPLSRKTMITQNVIERLGIEFPLHDVKAAAEDWLDYRPNHSKNDQVRGLRNQLTDPDRNWRFLKARQNGATPSSGENWPVYTGPPMHMAPDYTSEPVKYE